MYRLKSCIACIMVICVGLAFCGCSKDSGRGATATATQQDALVQQNKMLGRWHIVGHGVFYEKSNEREEVRYVQEEGTWQWTFYDDGSYALHAPEESCVCTYVITDDDVILSFNSDGSRLDPDYKIRYEGDEVHLYEYWHAYNAQKQEINFEGGYDGVGKYKYYILRRAN